MHIKGITLQGFKSFPERVTIWFDGEITAVVGPNGSGKSNIVDAIRWVLGEQSAKTLRGGKMEDLIFSGTIKRRPRQSAEVTLILDNSGGELPLDEKEVRVSRRVHQLKGSSYLLNGETCRLKDIENLLLDGGMRRDSSSILGQGKIESILMSKPMDRRELFEEASGIIKYKNRKKEARAKLDHTEQQQQRIRDIITELNRQARPLQEQARKAREYRDLQDRLFSLEVNLFLHRFNRYSLRLNKVFAEIEKIKEERDQKLRERAELGETLEKSTGFQRETLRELEQKREKIYQLGIKEEGLGNKIEINQEKIKVNRTARKERVEELENLSSLFDQKNEEKKELEKKLEQKEKKVSFLENRLESISQDEQEKIKRDHTLNQRREGLRTEIRESLDALNKKRQAQQELEGRIARMETRFQELKTSRQNNSCNLAEQKDHLEKRNSELKAKKEEQQNALNAEKKLNKELEKTREQYNSLEEQKNQKEKNLISIRNRLGVIGEFREKGRGYSSGVRLVLEEAEKGKLAGIRGVVAENYEVDVRYGEAIAAALEGREQNVIVDSDRAAQNAIQVLRRKNAGRVTFLPLALIAPRQLREEEKRVLKDPGILGTGLDLIEFPPEMQPVFSFLLGRVVIAEKMTQALEVYRKLKKKVRLVTLKGDVIQPGGAITGGGRRQRSLFKGSHQEAQLSRERDSLEQELQELEAKREKVGARRDKLRGQLEESRGRVYELQLAQKTLEKDISFQENNLEQMRSALEKNETGLNQLREEQETLEQKKEKNEQKISRLQENIQASRKKLQELEKEIDELYRVRGEHQNSVMDLRVEMAETSQEFSYTQKQLEKNRGEIEKINQQQEEKEEHLEKIHQSISQLESNINEWKEEKTSLREEQISLKSEKKELEEKREELQEKVEKLQKQTEILDEQVETLEKKMHRLEIERTRLQGEKEKISDWLYREYDLSIEKARSYADDSFQKKGAEKEIKLIKKKMEALGPVNLGAIEEYENLEKRLNFMREQHGDLREAQAILHRIIEGIDRNMARKFKNTFQEVNKEFEIIFNKLFQGGKAYLYLSDEEELLETGVEVVAQPPGKKLQKLSLMSGGEKALTAIALLFALMKVKPSPFYILDEIDAPLDDANVDRFISFLAEINDLSQFIIITHRKRTIAEASTIYGVTMEDEGVSRIISYRVKERAG